MTNWIDDEAQKHAESKAQKEKSDYLINYSNYWARLLKQIESDVEQINNYSIWKDALGNKPITTNHGVSGFEILKATFPFVSVIISNQGEHIEIFTTTNKNWQSEPKKNNKKLDVHSDGERLYLKWYKEVFFIPEQASQYILVNACGTNSYLISLPSIVGL